MLYEKTYNSPVGTLRLICSESGLKAVIFPEHKEGKIKTYETEKHSSHPILLQTEKELTEYFSNKRKNFNIPLDMSDATEFQKQVWEALLQIPYGQTISYSQQSKDILKLENSARAVASANSKNPLSIVVPCHRVIAADGSLHGYAGGLHIKKTLLELEKGELAIH